MTTTVLEKDLLSNIINLGGHALRSFLSILNDYANNPEASPYASIAHYRELWKEVYNYRKNPEKFSNDTLLKRDMKIPRIELRGNYQKDVASNVSLIGVPYEYAYHVQKIFNESNTTDLLELTPGGAMSVEITRKGVNKGLAVNFLCHNFEKMLEIIQYQAGPKINSLITHTIVMVDADGTIYGKPQKDYNPTLEESPAKNAIMKYLKAGGILAIITNNDLDRVIKRIGKSIPTNLKKNIILTANASADLAYFDPDGKVIIYDEYRNNALSQHYVDSRNEYVDTIYIADGGDEIGGDYLAYQAIGFIKSISVSTKAQNEVPKEIQKNYIGGLELGTKVLLDKIIEKANNKTHQKLFDENEIDYIVNETVIELKKIIIPEKLQLIDIMKEFQKQMVILHGHSTIHMNSSFIKPSNGNEEGDFIIIDWGGTNVRVMLVHLLPGKKPIIINSIQEKFTDDHIFGRINPFDFVCDLIRKLNLCCERNYSLGVAFSQPIKQISPKSAILIDWVKGWRIPEFINQNIDRLLQTSLNNSGLKNIQLKVLLNDVVATHLSVPQSSIGLVFGTGCAISVLNTKGEIIMTESGGFDSPLFPKTKFDVDLFDKCLPQKKHAFEKMVSGKYIGKLLRNIVQERLPNLNLSKCSDLRLTEMISLIEGYEDIEKIKIVLKEKVKYYYLPSNISDLDIKVLKEVSYALSQRAGRMVGAIILAAIRKQDPRLIKNHIIAVDGSVYLKHPKMPTYINEAISELRNELKDDLKGKLEFRHIQNATVFGVARACYYYSRADC